MKKERRPRIVISILVILLLLVVLSITLFIFIGKSETESTVDIEEYVDFGTTAYSSYRHNYTEPQHLSDEEKAEYDRYHPSVRGIVDIYSEIGLKEALLDLYEKLASSESAIELLEIQDGLLRAGASVPLILRDPQSVFELFEGDDNRLTTEQGQAAAEYLLAITYTKSSFYQAVVSDEEYDALQESSSEEERREIEKRIDERNMAIRQKGIEDLKSVFGAYPESIISLLARSDYSDYFDRKGAPKIDTKEETLQLAENIAANTAFVTAACLDLAVSFRDLEDLESALIFYERALDNPDFVTNSAGRTAHDVAKDNIDRIKGPN